MRVVRLVWLDQRRIAIDAASTWKVECDHGTVLLKDSLVRFAIGQWWSTEHPPASLST